MFAHATNTPNAGEDVLRVGLVAADRTALTTGTPTIFARYTEPTTNRVVEHLVSSVVTPTGTSQVNGCLLYTSPSPRDS